MLDAFIIEEIKRREQLDDRLQPRLERPGAYPMPYPSQPESAPSDWPTRRPYDDDDDTNGRNGVVIMDM